MDNFEIGKRAAIWFLWKQQKTSTQIYNEISVVYADNMPSKMTISRWIDKFSGGYDCVEAVADPQIPTEALILSILRKDQ